MAPQLPQAAFDALANRDPDRFCKAILAAVSRTFALGIKILPGDLGHAVLDAYLLCRIADTVEDAPLVAPDEKARLLDELASSFDDANALARFSEGAGRLTGEPAHLLLTNNADLVLHHFARLPAKMRAIVRHWVVEMITGMKKYVLRYPQGIRIQTVEEYKDYCYYVAGTVGYMLTDLWREHCGCIDDSRHAILTRRARAFAEALQTVNILKDIAGDAENENSIYLPQELLEQHGSSHSGILSPELLANNRAALKELIELAWHDLDEAQQYVVDIPRRAVKVRLFCILPLLLAYATLRDLLGNDAMFKRGGTVKIARAEVKSLLAAGAMTAMSNTGFRYLVSVTRRRQFRIPAF